MVVSRRPECCNKTYYKCTEMKEIGLNVSKLKIITRITF